jgi:hypothetical protein
VRVNLCVRCAMLGSPLCGRARVPGCALAARPFAKCRVCKFELKPKTDEYRIASRVEEFLRQT